MTTSTVFTNNGTQAVRLPAELRFPENTDCCWKTGLSHECKMHPPSWFESTKSEPSQIECSTASNGVLHLELRIPRGIGSQPHEIIQS